MRARIPIVLACAALLAVACQDTPSEPVDPPVATVPDFNFMNGPASPGNSGIERFPESYIFNFTVDWDKRWLVAFYDVWEGYAGCTLDYPDPALMEPWDIQMNDRETPEGTLTTLLLKGEHDVYIMDHLIYDQTEYDWDTEVCEWVMASWVYRGTGKFLSHREFLDGVPHRLDQGGNGIVQDREGNYYRLHYKERIEGADWTYPDMIRLEVTPTGN